MSRGFEVMSKDCGQCLMTKNRIVSGARAAQIVADTRRTQQHFICHKSPKGREIACRLHHDTGISQMGRIAERLGCVIMVDPDTLERVQP